VCEPPALGLQPQCGRRDLEAELPLAFAGRSQARPGSALFVNPNSCQGHAPAQTREGKTDHTRLSIGIDVGARWLDVASWPRREAARRIGITETALRKAASAGRISREPDGQWDIDKTRRALVETADPSRSPLAGSANADATPFARLKVAQLALKVEAQRLALDLRKRRLIDVAEADATIDQIAGAMRDALLNWPARVSGVIAAELGVEPHLRQTILQQHVNDLLTEEADRFDPPGLGGERGQDV
jgi:hypothetical protein